MRFYSTNKKSPLVSARQAVLQGLAADGGLFMPVEIPEMNKTFIKMMATISFHELAFEIGRKFFKQEITDADLQLIIKRAFTFTPVVVQLDDLNYVMELFHGPTLAFKDFGACFMGQLMAHFVKNDTRVLTILVATSGDTGSAVASGFFGAAGIEVILLYPKNKVSLLQEKQLTTMGGNITALEIEGNFDDCQHLVKKAFVDPDLLGSLRLTSANSINISRLIPQSFYYFYALGQLQEREKSPVISVPSGNFGNLTAGLFAKRLGLPVKKYIAATNANDVFPRYLSSGIYRAKPSIKTLSNAMDVGNPSNFDRILALYDENLSAIRADIWSASFTDKQTIAAMQKIFGQYRYVMDPHGAVGYLGLLTYRKKERTADCGIILETAHPAKFNNIIEKALAQHVALPDTLQSCLKKPKQAIGLSNKYTEFKDYLFSRKN
jgi:threonine synthase